MRRLSLALDALAVLRESASASECDLTAAAVMAELAGANAIRIGINEDLKPVSEIDVHDVRRAARSFELRMPPSQGLLKVAMEVRPELVLLAAEGWEGACVSLPLDLRVPASGLSALCRTLDDASIRVGVLIAPDLESVKVAHGLGVKCVEFFTGRITDLPETERDVELQSLSDAARLAQKLRLSVGVGGALGYRTVHAFAAAAPSIEWVAAGRAPIARALLVGIDRAVRDFRALCDRA